MAAFNYDSPPLDPSAEEARQWLRDELSKPVYHEQEKSLIARFIDWVVALFSQSPDMDSVPGIPVGALVTIVLVAAGVILLALLLGGWLIPQASRRRVTPLAGAIFAEDRSRTHYLQAAQDAAGRNDWMTACTEAFRALITLLIERQLISELPGLTAREAASAASALLPPSHAQGLEVAAQIFNSVRFGRWEGSPDAYQQLMELDSCLRHLALDSSAKAPAHV